MLEESQILDILAKGSATKNEIAKALSLKGGARIALKTMLKRLVEEGRIELGARRRFSMPGILAEVVVVAVEKQLTDGTLVARPQNMDDAPEIYIYPDDPKAGNMTEGSRGLVRLGKKTEDKIYTGKVIKVFESDAHARIVGVYRTNGRTPVVEPVNRKDRNTYRVIESHKNIKAKDYDLVAANVLTDTDSRIKQVQLAERICKLDDPEAISLIAIAEQEIPDVFPEDVIAEAESLTAPKASGKRQDLRDIPLVTIDGSDSRDFDDAIFAEPTDDGWHLMVAIADVAHYVPEDSALDREAYKRGNSVYFPDRVVPMLPEALSNDLCSLRPDEERACLAVHMWIDKNGKKLKHEFVRGVMKSAARLIYEDVEAEKEKYPDLFGAFAALTKEREKRGTLDLNVPERKIIFNDQKQIEDIRLRESLESHRLIEEFMVLANVCAAETLIEKDYVCVFRVHDVPSAEKLDGLSTFLDEFDYSLPKGKVAKPHSFMQILDKAKGTEEERVINQMVLRSQSQAKYDVDNIGHFGLALAHYAHFTSPIRRYADLLVHRALVSALNLGDDGFTEKNMNKLHPILSRQAEHISVTERRAVQAERDSTDRYLAKYMEEKEGTEFLATVSGVTRFGLFITLEETGADGFVSMRSMRSDFYELDEGRKAIVGKRTGKMYRMGDSVRVRLETVEALSGSLSFSILDETSRRGSWGGGDSRGGDRGGNRGASRGGPRRDNRSGGGDRPYRGNRDDGDKKPFKRDGDKPHWKKSKDGDDRNDSRRRDDDRGGRRSWGDKPEGDRRPSGKPAGKSGGRSYGKPEGSKSFGKKSYGKPGGRPSGKSGGRPAGGGNKRGGPKR